MKTALITGASGGIGLELARIMASENYNLVLAARSRGLLEQIADELTGKYKISVTVFDADLTKIASVDTIYSKLKEESILIDVLINNAGFGDFSPFAESEWKKDLDMIELNITALTYFTRLFLPEMLSRKKGRIMNVASTAAFQPGPLMAVYYATKAYVLSFSEAVANEVHGTGVTITALCPGTTASGFQKAASLDESKLFKWRKLPSSAEVAEYGYKAMLAGKRVAIHGKMNYLMANSIRFVPRNIVTAIVRFIQAKVK